MVMKIKGTKKSQKKRGQNSYHGSRKKQKGSGHRGGIGMAGTGKRADHKKSLVIKLYGNSYFGKKGITSKGTARKKIEVINLRDISKNLENLKKKYDKNGVLELKKYRVLGEGELKVKLKIKAKGFTKTAKEKIEEMGGEVIIIREKGISEPSEGSKDLKDAEGSKEPQKKDVKDSESKNSENLK